MRGSRHRAASTKKSTGKATPKGLELVESIRAPHPITGNPAQSASTSCGAPTLPMEAGLAHSSLFQSRPLQAIPIEEEMAWLALENRERMATLRGTRARVGTSKGSVGTRNDAFSRMLIARKRDGHQAMDMSVATMSVSQLIDEVAGIQYHTHGTEAYHASALRVRETVDTLQTKLRKAPAWDPAWKANIERLAPKPPPTAATSTPAVARAGSKVEGPCSSAAGQSAQPRVAASLRGSSSGRPGSTRPRKEGATVYQQAREAKREMLRARKGGSPALAVV